MPRQSKAIIWYNGGTDIRYFSTAYDNCEGGGYRQHVSGLADTDMGTSGSTCFGAWCHFENFVVGSSSGAGKWHSTIYRSNGTIDALLRDNITTQSVGTPNQITIGGAYYDMCASSNTATLDVDDVVIDTTPARVLLCTGSSFSARGSCDYQPATAWSATSITASAKTGKFAPDSTAYIYVFDATDAANSSGYPVTIGSGGTTYTVTPSAGANGSISPSTPQTVSSGGTIGFTVTPNGGYTASVGGTCGGSLAGTAYTTNAIVADCTVSATFSGDSTPPIVSNPSPSGILNYGTSSAAMGVSTNEAATCKYGTSDVAYASLPNTFSTTGGTTHAQSYSVSGGNSYTLYVRCQDGSGNANSSSTTIAFSVSGDEIILDDTDASASQSGSWSPSTYWPNYYAVGYLYAPDATGHWYRWTKTVPAGTYRVYAWWPATAGRPTDVQIDVTHSGGTANVTADQTAHGGMWNLLGQWTFGTTATVQINSSSTGTDGAAADAIRFLLSTSDGTPPVLSNALPSGVQASVVSSVTLQVTTDEAATCKEGPVGSDYAAKTAFSNTGSTSHSLSFSVSPGRVYWLGYQCQDGSANTSSETVVRFAIPAVPKRRLRH